jgi:hypothetical protein
MLVSKIYNIIVVASFKYTGQSHLLLASKSNATPALLMYTQPLRMMGQRNGRPVSSPTTSNSFVNLQLLLLLLRLHLGSNLTNDLIDILLRIFGDTENWFPSTNAVGAGGSDELFALGARPLLELLA